MLKILSQFGIDYPSYHIKEPSLLICFYKRSEYVNYRETDVFVYIRVVFFAFILTSSSM